MKPGRTEPDPAAEQVRQPGRSGASVSSPGAGGAGDSGEGAGPGGAGSPGGGGRRRAAVLGSPVKHSLSPVLHAAAYREQGLAGWSYDAIECDSDGLARLLGSLGPEWAGLSLTMPLKRTVLSLLDWSEQLVSDVGGANTVLLGGGRRLGYNTDVAGMVTALAEAGVSLRPADDVLVLGAGATACSALAALQLAGAAEVTIAVRDEGRAGLAREVAGRLGLTIRLTGLGPDEVSGAWQLLVSTVPGGVADGIAGLVAAGDLVAGAVFDVVYDPWPTALAASAAAAGATVISGFELLLHQAAGQFELMTGRTAPVAVMRAAGLAEIARRQARVG